MTYIVSLQTLYIVLSVYLVTSFPFSHIPSKRDDLHDVDVTANFPHYASTMQTFISYLSYLLKPTHVTHLKSDDLMSLQTSPIKQITHCKYTVHIGRGLGWTIT